MKIKEQSRATIPTDYGKFIMAAFSEAKTEKSPELAIFHPEMNPNEPVVVRLHSECLTGDIFHSKRCDCGDQLALSLKIIKEYKGIVLYLRQEGRGIGLIEKLKAYRLQDNGLDTVDANIELGHEADERDYANAAEILKLLGVKQVKLLTNNPHKANELIKNGIEVTEMLAHVIPANAENKAYLDTKVSKMGHKF